MPFVTSCMYAYSLGASTRSRLLLRSSMWSPRRAGLLPPPDVRDTAGVASPVRRQLLQSGRAGAPLLRSHGHQRRLVAVLRHRDREQLALAVLDDHPIAPQVLLVAVDRVALRGEMPSELAVHDVMFARDLELHVVADHLRAAVGIERDRKSTWPGAPAVDG